MWCNKCQRIQALNLKQKPGPLTRQLMKSLDCYQRSCVQNLRKSNYDAQQQRVLASSSTNVNIQQQKSSYSATWIQEPTKSYRPKQNQPYWSETQSQSFTFSRRKAFSKRSSNTKQFPSSKHVSSSTKFWKPSLSTACLTTPRYSSGRKMGPLCGKMGRSNTKQMGPFYRMNGFRIPFNSAPPLLTIPISLSQSSSPLLREEITELLQERAVERVQDPGTPNFYSRLFLVPKKNRELRPVIDLSLLNQCIKKQPFKMEIQVSTPIDTSQRLGCLHRSDRCLSTRSDSSSIQEVPSFHVRKSDLPIHGLTFRNVPKSVDFHQTNGRNLAAHLRQRATSLFRYLDDWLIRDLNSQQTHISHNILPSNNSKSRIHSKSKEVRYDTSSAIHLHRNGISTSDFQITRISNSDKFRHEFSFLFSASKDVVLLGRFHLRPLPM